MKKTILTLLAVLAVQMATAGPALALVEGSGSYTVVLAAGGAENTMEISLSADGREYVITSAVPLEVGGTVCENAPGSSTVLVCKAPMVAGFQVNAGPNNDSIAVARDVRVPVTVRAGAGDDAVFGGSGADKLVGGPGDDQLVGRAGEDLIVGCAGDDAIYGGPGGDVLRGGVGKDVIFGGPGENDIRQDPSP